MAIDFRIPEEAQQVRAEVRRWVDEECLPAEARITEQNHAEIVTELRIKARSRRLWCPFVPMELGGMGLGPLANALVQLELGRSFLGPLSMNSQAPDDATIQTLIKYGTEDQKQRFLLPLLRGEKRVCYAMTEKAAGSDATGMRTSAERRGDHYVLNGEKWFTSCASNADIAVVMARTNPDAPRHKQFSTFLVELPNPGFRIVRDIETMVAHDLISKAIGASHAEVAISDLAVPASNLLGQEGGGFGMGQHRLAYGRLRHGMNNISIAQRALDLAAARVTERSTFGEPLAKRQGVQWMLADCASQLYIARLMLLHIAFKAEHGLDLKHENSMAKVFLANMVHQVVDTAIQLHGALGYTHDTPLARWYTHVRAERLADGPNEIHRWTIGRNLLKAYREHGTTASAAGGDLL